MGKKQLKKILAGFSIASLLTGSVLTLSGCNTKSSTSCSGKTGDSETKQEGTKTSCSGTKEGAKTSCSGAKTSCSGTKGETGQ